MDLRDTLSDDAPSSSDADYNYTTAGGDSLDTRLLYTRQSRLAPKGMHEDMFKDMTGSGRAETVKVRHNRTALPAGMAGHSTQPSMRRNIDKQNRTC
jgi:hypothetical protein